MSSSGGGGAVFSQKTASGFKQDVFVMFHGTKPEHVAPILRGGFTPSDPKGNMLGSGIYITILVVFFITTIIY